VARERERYSGKSYNDKLAFARDGRALRGDEVMVQETRNKKTEVQYKRGGKN
jgi:hypothetical protein